MIFFRLGPKIGPIPYGKKYTLFPIQTEHFPLMSLKRAGQNALRKDHFRAIFLKAMLCKDCQNACLFGFA